MINKGYKRILVWGNKDLLKVMWLDAPESKLQRSALGVKHLHDSNPKSIDLFLLLWNFCSRLNNCPYCSLVKLRGELFLVWNFCRLNNCPYCCCCCSYISPFLHPHLTVFIILKRFRKAWKGFLIKKWQKIVFIRTNSKSPPDIGFDVSCQRFL